MQTPGPARPTHSASLWHGTQVNDCGSQTGFALLEQSAATAHSTQAPLGPQTGVLA
jgi:hypothetical protein